MSVSTRHFTWRPEHYNFHREQPSALKHLPWDSEVHQPSKIPAVLWTLAVFAMLFSVWSAYGVI